MFCNSSTHIHRYFIKENMKKIKEKKKKRIIYTEI